LELPIVVQKVFFFVDRQRLRSITTSF